MVRRPLREPGGEEEDRHALLSPVDRGPQRRVASARCRNSLAFFSAFLLALALAALMATAGVASLGARGHRGTLGPARARSAVEFPQIHFGWWAPPPEQEESESTTPKGSEESESTKVKGSEESESTTVKDSEDSEFTPLEGSEESESKATLGGSEESESSTLRGWWTTTPRPEHKGHGAAWWPPTHGPSTTSTAASTSSTARNSTSTSSSRRSTTSTSAEPTSTSAKPTSTSATPKKTTATSITTPSTCPMVSFYGSPQARCFCQLARNPGCPGCSCPQGCQQVTWDHPRSVTFKNIRQASHCWGQSTVGLLTIPRSYFRDLKVLSDKCNAGMAGLLAEMLRDAFATYQQNFGHGRVMQCIHSPGHISTPWLHLHTFCEHGVMDAMPLAPAKANPVAWCGDMGSPDEAEVMAREVVAWASSHCSGCMV